MYPISPSGSFLSPLSFHWPLLAYILTKRAIIYSHLYAEFFHFRPNVIFPGRDFVRFNMRTVSMVSAPPKRPSSKDLYLSTPLLIRTTCNGICLEVDYYDKTIAKNGFKGVIILRYQRLGCIIIWLRGRYVTSCDRKPWRRRKLPFSSMSYRH
jgi:hypothetical protein